MVPSLVGYKLQTHYLEWSFSVGQQLSFLPVQLLPPDLRVYAPIIYVVLHTDNKFSYRFSQYVNCVYSRAVHILEMSFHICQFCLVLLSCTKCGSKLSSCFPSMIMIGSCTLTFPAQRGHDLILFCDYVPKSCSFHCKHIHHLQLPLFQGLNL